MASIDDLIKVAVDEAIAGASGAIADKVRELVSARLAEELGSVRKKRRQQPATPIEIWKPDKRARRVPLFVIDLTGLNTKTLIVARYGADAVFRKGHPAPKPLK